MLLDAGREALLMLVAFVAATLAAFTGPGGAAVLLSALTLAYGVRDPSRFSRSLNYQSGLRRHLSFFVPPQIMRSAVVEEACRRSAAVVITRPPRCFAGCVKHTLEP
jgi:hypothetical protein